MDNVASGITSAWHATKSQITASVVSKTWKTSAPPELRSEDLRDWGKPCWASSVIMQSQVTTSGSRCWGLWVAARCVKTELFMLHSLPCVPKLTCCLLTLWRMLSNCQYWSKILLVRPVYFCMWDGVGKHLDFCLTLGLPLNPAYLPCSSASWIYVQVAEAWRKVIMVLKILLYSY